jgi:hypothetical protein
VTGGAITGGACGDALTGSGGAGRDRAVGEEQPIARATASRERIARSLRDVDAEAYAAHKGPEVAAKALALELKNGFRWTRELAALIRGHQKERIDFVPRLTALLARLGQG